jgi:hypothetical protein
MTRLPFAVAVLFVFTSPARADPLPPVPPATVAATTDADYQDAAKRLFPSDPVEQQAFLFSLRKDTFGKGALIRSALIDARKAGDDAAITAAFVKNSDAAQAEPDVLGAISDARKALDAGLHATPPTTDFSATPLVGALMKGLGAKDPAALFKTLNVSQYGGDLSNTPPKAVVTAGALPCKPGATALDTAKAINAGQANMDGSPCTKDGGTANTVTVPTGSTARPTGKTDGGDPKSTVTDMHPTTGVPPTPGSVRGTDKGPAGSSTGGGGLPFSMGTMTSVGLMAGMGALIGTFGGPVGIVAGAILGGLFGLFISTRKSDDGS